MANKVTHFLDSLSNDIVSLGYQILRWSRTLDVSPVTLYLGVGGRSLKTPLKNLFTLSSEDIYALLLEEIVPLGCYLKFRIVPLSYMFVLKSR